jgi:transketolase
MSETQHGEQINVNFGCGNVVKNGKSGTVLCFGPMLKEVLEATHDMDVTVLYYSTVLPFDGKILLDNFNETIIICEPFYEGTVNHLVDFALAGKRYRKFNIGVPRRFLTNYGEKKEHDRVLGLDSLGIKEKIQKCLT